MNFDAEQGSGIKVLERRTSTTWNPECAIEVICQPFTETCSTFIYSPAFMRDLVRTFAPPFFKRRLPTPFSNFDL
jgi:hypothetical protein